MSPKEHAIYCSPIQSIGLAAPDQYQNSKLLTDYQDVAKKVLKHFFDHNVNATGIIHHSTGQHPSMTSLLDLPQSVVDFETKLAMITPPKELQMDAASAYNKMSAAKFEALFPAFSLSTFVKALGPSDAKADSVIVTDPGYLHKLDFLLQSTPKEVLKAFFVWKAVQQHADNVDDPALKPLKDFRTALRGSRVEQPPERWRKCVQDAKNDMPWIASWFFLSGTEPDLKKSVASNVVKAVADSFAKSLQKLDWMAKNDTLMSAKKVQSIDKQLGRPKGLDAGSIESYYSNLAVDEATFYKNKVSAMEFAAHQQWSMLSKATRAKQWDITPLSTKPDYDASLNRLIVPAAVLRKPLTYDDTVPAYALFGSFGAISGHGITKALGPVGSYFDKHGVLNDQWSSKTREEFQKKAQCFIDHYSSYSVKGADGKAHPVNGNLTLASNLADIAGAHAAFHAWKEYEKKHPSLKIPGLDKYSKEQIFWIAFGNTLCAKTTPERQVHQVQVHDHAPENVRILVSGHVFIVLLLIFSRAPLPIQKSSSRPSIAQARSRSALFSNSICHRSRLTTDMVWLY
jgi:endothelin-converting enzyme